MSFSLVQIHSVFEKLQPFLAAWSGVEQTSRAIKWSSAVFMRGCEAQHVGKERVIRFWRYIAHPWQQSEVHANARTQTQTHSSINSNHLWKLLLWLLHGSEILFLFFKQNTATSTNVQSSFVRGQNSHILDDFNCRLNAQALTQSKCDFTHVPHVPFEKGFKHLLW